MRRLLLPQLPGTGELGAPTGILLRILELSRACDCAQLLTASGSAASCPGGLRFASCEWRCEPVLFVQVPDASRALARAGAGAEAGKSHGDFWKEYLER